MTVWHELCGYDKVHRLCTQHPRADRRFFVQPGRVLPYPAQWFARREDIGTVSHLQPLNCEKPRTSDTKGGSARPLTASRLGLRFDER
jgi:hypothetical protein